MSLLLDVAAAACLLLGVLLTVLAGLGLVRFPDVLTRMHAQSKPAVLGVLFVLLGVALAVRTPAIVGPILLVGTFQVLTSPIGSHMMGRAVGGLRAQASRKGSADGTPVLNESQHPRNPYSQG